MGRRSKGFLYGLMLMLAVACSGNGMVLQKSPQGKASVRLPAVWKAVTDLVPNTDLQFSDPDHRRYFVMVSEARKSLKNNTLEKYSDFTRESILEGLKKRESWGPRYLRIGGLKALQYEIGGVVEGQRFLYLHTIVEGPEYFHQMVAWTHASLKDQNWPLLNQITESFREKD